jgi:hypothetical protein
MRLLRCITLPSMRWPGSASAARLPTPEAGIEQTDLFVFILKEMQPWQKKN